MLNVITYCIYLVITYFITIKVGLVFYKNGKVFVFAILDGNALLTDHINKILLLLYYLLNLGYCALMLGQWQVVLNYTQLFESIILKTGTICMVLACIHFCNVFAIIGYSHYKKLIHF